MHEEMEKFISLKIDDVESILREEYGDSLEKVTNVIGDDNGDLEIALVANTPEHFINVQKAERLVNQHGFKTETVFITSDKSGGARAVLTFYYYAF